MTKTSKKSTFIDAFAGCGGLSLGLMQAKLSGLFAIEKDENAFSTLSQNLIQGNSKYKFAWPAWLPKEAASIEKIIADYPEKLAALRGTIDILAGGPPCQGFSTAGRRKASDPRNRLFRSYVELVRLVEPKIVLMENVRGFTMHFGGDEAVNNYSEKLYALLSQRYSVHEGLVDLSAFGVPQQRTRYFLIALHPDLGDVDPFELIRKRLAGFLRRLNIQAPVSSWSAISDLETTAVGTQPSTESAGFMETKPGPKRTAFQKLMASPSGGVSDLRLARHKPEISQRFAEIINLCHAEGRLNTSIGTEIRNLYGLKKQALRVLDPDRPSPTITSMPDDLLHYKEPRTLTVRENARLQSFPDWFVFKGKYTTGGERRKIEVPRFTQVANAVPPLAAQAIGEALSEILSGATARQPERAKQPVRRLRGSLERSMQIAELVT